MFGYVLLICKYYVIVYYYVTVSSPVMHHSWVFFKIHFFSLTDMNSEAFT